MPSTVSDASRPSKLEPLTGSTAAICSPFKRTEWSESRLPVATSTTVTLLTQVVAFIAISTARMGRNHRFFEQANRRRIARQ